MVRRKRKMGRGRRGRRRSEEMGKGDIRLLFPSQQSLGSRILLVQVENLKVTLMG